MIEQYLYLVAVVAICCAVVFLLRAVPFILFSCCKKQLPKRMEWFFVSILSPMIILGVIIWAYSGLEYTTFNPYIAGALTIGIHLWRRNAIVSVLVGTITYMALVNLSGCTSERIVSLDRDNPSIHVTRLGIMIEERYVEIIEVPKLLIENDIPKTRVIHILVDNDLQELDTSRTLMGVLAAAGYSRPVLVTKQHADVEAKKQNSRSSMRSSEPPPLYKAPKPVKYKKTRR